MATIVRSLKGDRAFQRLRSGRSGGARLLSLRWKPSREPGVRVGIVVSRKVGNAVTRNRVRRRLREALRAYLAPRELGERGFDMIVIARPQAANAEYAALRDSLETALTRSEFP